MKQACSPDQISPPFKCTFRYPIYSYADLKYNISQAIKYLDWYESTLNPAPESKLPFPIHYIIAPTLRVNYGDADYLDTFMYNLPLISGPDTFIYLYSYLQALHLILSHKDLIGTVIHSDLPFHNPAIS